MKRIRSVVRVSAALLIAIVLSLVLTPSARGASKFKTLYGFRGEKDGRLPSAGLVFDTAGNLYSTTFDGGINNLGAVFKLKRNSNGSWTESVIHSFAGNGDNDGVGPEAGLVFDLAGNLYGTTAFGGQFNGGTVFELTPRADGSWKESVLHSFNCLRQNDGCESTAGLTIDGAGNLYGTTQGGGASGMGVVYELSPNLDGSWKMKILHGFTGGSDGGDPQAALILDATGKLYGTTSGGGLTKCGAGCGVIFELDPNANGTWKEKVLYRFSGADGENPLANVILDAAGNVYGATLSGGNTGCGSLGCGLVFELTPNVDGTWREKVLHRFTGADGDSPLGSVILDAAGNLYGTTMFGGNLSMCSGYGCGVVFTLTPNSNGVWKETVLHSFSDVPGAIPYAGAIIDAAGNLFGTTHGDGVTSFGSVFEITP